MPPPSVLRLSSAPLSTMHMYPISGAAARVPYDATAFGYRNGGWVGVVTGIDPDPANLPAAASWAQHYWQELHSSSAGGGYVNMMMEERRKGPGPGRVPWQLRPARADQAALRPDQPVQHQPQHFTFLRVRLGDASLCRPEAGEPALSRGNGRVGRVQPVRSDFA